jgi:beta-galactosidase
VSIDAKGEAATSYELAVTAPQLWSPDAPSLYRAEVRLQVDGQTVDTLETTIGIRQVEISAERGLLINGQPYELVGGNVHHDNGPLGAAAHDRAEERRVEILKAAGFNAIRTSHNPPSTAFLDACDRLGMLVIDEAFDGWAQRKVAHDYSRVFDDWWQRDIAAMVRRDRNHPSVIMWSIGNEVYERGSEAGAQRAAGLAAHVRTLDPTRPVTIGLNGLGKPEDWPRLDRVFTSLDVAGYNYELARHTEDHARLPERVVYSSESYLRDVFADWQASVGHSHVIGAFVWTALDYLGEAGIGRVFPPDEPAQVHWEGNHFPWHGAACGDIDHTGWRKPVSHYRNIVWDRGKSLYAAVRAPAPGGGPWNLTPWAVEPALPSWTWPGQEGRELTVDVYSRHEAVRLYRNDTLIGEQPTTDDEEFHAVFQVPYQLGALRAVGINGGAEVETFALETAGEPAAIRMSVDRSTIRADGSDLAFVEVAIVDEQGRRRFDAEPSIRYELTGPGRIIAVGSSDLTSTQSYQANPRKAYQGRALVVIRSTTDSGQIKLTATANGISDGNMKIRSALQ